MTLLEELVGSRLPATDSERLAALERLRLAIEREGVQPTFSLSRIGEGTEPILSLLEGCLSSGAWAVVLDALSCLSLLVKPRYRERERRKIDPSLPLLLFLPRLFPQIVHYLADIKVSPLAKEFFLLTATREEAVESIYDSLISQGMRSKRSEVCEASILTVSSLLSSRPPVLPSPPLSTELLSALATCLSFPEERVRLSSQHCMAWMREVVPDYEKALVRLEREKKERVEAEKERIASHSGLYTPMKRPGSSSGKTFAFSQPPASSRSSSASSKSLEDVLSLLEREEVSGEERVRATEELTGLTARKEEEIAQLIGKKLVSLSEIGRRGLLEAHHRVNESTLSLLSLLAQKLGVSSSSLFQSLFPLLMEKLGESRSVRQKTIILFRSLMRLFGSSLCLEILKEARMHSSSKVREEALKLIMLFSLSFQEEKENLLSLAAIASGFLLDPSPTVSAVCVDCLGTLQHFLSLSFSSSSSPSFSLARELSRLQPELQGYDFFSLETALSRVSLPSLTADKLLNYNSGSATPRPRTAGGRAGERERENTRSFLAPSVPLPTALPSSASPPVEQGKRRERPEDYEDLNKSFFEEEEPLPPGSLSSGLQGKRVERGEERERRETGSQTPTRLGEGTPPDRNSIASKLTTLKKKQSSRFRPPPTSSSSAAAASQKEGEMIEKERENAEERADQAETPGSFAFGAGRHPPVQHSPRVRQGQGEGEGEKEAERIYRKVEKRLDEKQEREQSVSYGGEETEQERERQRQARPSPASGDGDKWQTKPVARGGREEEERSASASRGLAVPAGGAKFGERRERGERGSPAPGLSSSFADPEEQQVRQPSPVRSISKGEREKKNEKGRAPSPSTASLSTSSLLSSAPSSSSPLDPSDRPIKASGAESYLAMLEQYGEEAYRREDEGETAAEGPSAVTKKPFLRRRSPQKPKVEATRKSNETMMEDKSDVKRQRETLSSSSSSSCLPPTAAATPAPLSRSLSSPAEGETSTFKSRSQQGVGKKVSSQRERERNRDKEKGREREKEKDPPPPSSKSKKWDTSKYLRDEEFEASSNPQSDLKEALLSLASEEWERVFLALNTVRQLAIFHPEMLLPHLHSIVLEVKKQVMNLRSSVSKNALLTLSSLFLGLRERMDREGEEVIGTILKRCSDTNAFLSSSADEALGVMLESLSPSRSLSSLLTQISSRNAVVRQKIAEGVCYLLSSSPYASRLLSALRERERERDQLVKAVSSLLIDNTPDARQAAKGSVWFLVKRGNIDSSLFLKVLPSAAQKDLLRFLDGGEPKVKPMTKRTEGEGPEKKERERPKKDGSSGVRGTGKSEGDRMGNSPEKEVGKELKKRTRTSESSRGGGSGGGNNSELPGKEAEDLMQFEKELHASDWRERLDAFQRFQSFLVANGAALARGSRAQQVLDLLIERIQDGNMKVNVAALESLRDILPLFRDHLPSALASLLPALITHGTATNKQLQELSSLSLSLLPQLLSPSLLLQPLAQIAQFGSPRARVLATERLAELTVPAYTEKPAIVIKYLIPLAFKTMGEQKSDMSHASSLLLSSLCRAMGSKILEQTQALSSADQQRIQALLHASGRY